MSMKNRRQQMAKPRTTLALGGTTATPKLQLDHRSHVSVEWARLWFKTGPGRMGVDPLVSGVARRAIALYIQHLQRPDLDFEKEAREVRGVCSVLYPDPEDAHAAWKRLADHQRGNPFPSFSDVLDGPQQARKWADLEDRVDALVSEIYRQRFKPKTTS
jgi:hypothetical protein